MYAQEWEEYRNPRAMVLGLLLGGGPVLFIVGILLSQVLPDEIANNAFLTIGALWMLAIVAAEIRMRNWRCPRCGQYFLDRAKIGNELLQKRCFHCGLEKWDEGEAEKDERFFLKNL